MRIAVFAITALLCFGADTSAPARLEKQLELVSHATDGVVGAAATHIESGRTVSLRGSEAFPMASAFKVPIAVQIFSLIDESRLTLDKMVVVGPQDYHPGSGKISDLLYHPGLSLSVENLLELALVISDNTAADLLLREAGGPGAVTERMKKLGFTKIRVDRSTAELISDWSGVKALPPESEWTRDIWDRLYDAVPEREHMAARRLQTASLHDTASPDDMNRLIVGLWEKTLLSQPSSNKLLAIMARCQTGKARIKGLLPEGTEVAHKTGSLGGVVNDIGIITLPGGLGHVALSVFTKGSTRSEEASERAIAEVARTVYDYFTLVQ